MFTLKSKISGISAFLRHLALAVFVMSVSVGAGAATTEKALLVQLTNGDRVVFLLSTVPVVTFDGNKCSIKSDDFSAQYPMPDIEFAKIIDRDGSSSIDEPTHSVVVDLSNPDEVRISGMKAGSETVLFNLSGVVLRRVNSDEAGVAVLNISELPSSVYIVSSKETTFKIYKK